MLLRIYNCAHYTRVGHNVQAQFKQVRQRGSLSIPSVTGETAQSISRGPMGWCLPARVSRWRGASDYCFFV